MSPLDDSGHNTAMSTFASPSLIDRRPLYLNVLGQERDPVAARTSALAVYGPDKLERLVALKHRYDPDKVFRLNHNIPPG